MTKPLIELVEEAIRKGVDVALLASKGKIAESLQAGREGDALLSEIRQRLSSLQQDADLVPALMLQIERLEAGSVGVVAEDCVVMSRVPPDDALQRIWNSRVQMPAVWKEGLLGIIQALAEHASNPLPTITPQRLSELEANERLLREAPPIGNCNTIGYVEWKKKVDAAIDASRAEGGGRG